MKKSLDRLLCIALGIIFALAFAASATAETAADTITSDIIAGIDHSSIVVDGSSTFFSSTMSDGTVVRFEGTDISIDLSGIIMKPEGKITSLDSVGSIYTYYVSIQDGDQAPLSEQWLDVGYAYTNSAENLSFDRADHIYADTLMGYPVAAWNEDAAMPMAEFVPNFVFVKAASGNTMDMTLTCLAIEYNPAEKFTPIEIPRQALPDYFINFEEFFENTNAISEEAPVEISEEPFVEISELANEYSESQEIGEAPVENTPVAAEPAESSMIYSDIIAGIDPSSVFDEDGATFFSSIMSDGTEVRFEGTNISVDADGINITPESTVTSLDAVGQIHLYQASVKNGEEAPISEQYLDVGYGYTLSPDFLNMGRASDIFTEAIYGSPAIAWNQGATISMDEYLPNFVFFAGSGASTQSFTLTSLTIGYDPSKLYTNIETQKETLPDYVYTALTAEVEVIEYAAEAEPVSDDFIDINTLAEMKMAETGGIYSDIIAGIDLNSIWYEGDTTFFSSIMSNGSVIRFEGTNISVDEDGLTLNPESRITALDAIGTIYLYRATIKDGSTDPVRSQNLNVGGGYSFDPEITSVDRADELSANGTSGLSAADWNNDCMASMIQYQPNFVFFDAAPQNTLAITLTSLTVGYDPSEKYTDSSYVEEYLTGYFHEHTGGAPSGNTETKPALETAETDYAEGELLEGDISDIEMAKPSAITSDIVAGLDRNSISVDGDTTFFSSVMSDGSVVRFEGKNISITADGIAMNPSSSITSLDAVGKIFQYSGNVRNQDEAPASEQWIGFGYGYTFSADKTSVEHASDIFTSSGYTNQAFMLEPDYTVSVAFHQPNFIYIDAKEFNTAAFTLTSLSIGYNPEEKVTAITDMDLYAYRYGYYMEGEPYNFAKEDKADEASGDYDFYLQLKLEVMDEYGIDDLGKNENWVWFLPNDFYEVGDLKNAEGNVLDKQTARVHAGTTLDVTVGDYSFTLELPMADLYEGAQTLNEARPYSTQSAVGEKHTLVVPIVWADQTGLVSDELYAHYQKALGKLIDGQGTPTSDLTDADDDFFSLTEYFDTASYGQLEISSFMTDWYYTDKTFTGDYEYIFPEVEFADEVLQWVKETYPDTDWTQFDQDGDGCVDAMIFISVGLSQDGSYMPASFGGAVHSTGNSYGKRAGTQQDPQANCFLTVNHAFLMEDTINTLIHEFSHNFGLNDYYDASYSGGVDAVGQYDMESSNVGDWNAYSKLAVGWMDPQIVSGLASGESIDLTIGSSALTDDMIILPAAGTQYSGPFGEYVMIDLFSPDGVNAYDAAEYGLENTVGVRISHVNANMRSTTESDGAIGDVQDNGNIIGTELYTNVYDDTFGFYNVEVIQAGGVNTFTDLNNLRSALSAEDLFQAGDTFTAEEYDQFFYQGRMDNGMALGYRVEIIRIDTDDDGHPSATIRITAE